MDTQIVTTRQRAPNSATRTGHGRILMDVVYAGPHSRLAPSVPPRWLGDEADSRPIATLKGSAATVQAMSATSESPKLHSVRPVTRKPDTAARLPTTTVRSRPRAGSASRRSSRVAETKNVTQIESHAVSPTTPLSTRICSGELWTCPVVFLIASGNA